MTTNTPTLFLVLFGAFNPAAANWPQFCGPHASGVETNGVVPTRWDVERGENLRWRTPIPGPAHASPVIWNDRIYLATAVRPGKADLKVGLYGDIESANDQEPQQWRLLALDKATGKVIWDKLGQEAVPRVKRHPKSSHASSTPATDGRRVVAIFGSEGLFCRRNPVFPDPRTPDCDRRVARVPQARSFSWPRSADGK